MKIDEISRTLLLLPIHFSRHQVLGGETMADEML